MRYEDASGSFSQAATGTTDARNDEDALAAGSKGPATGNTITGAGTITGTAGADLVASGPGEIVALEGAGGSDSGDGGSLHVEGRFGELTMDSRGSYSYDPNADTPNGGRDVFRYTLADAQGARDTATLTIDIGRELEKIDANAQQIIPGPDGVVTLPPGVQLSDVHVVGRNLVIDLPDGTQMVIIDGAVFVPQLVLGGVEVPASNLAALLIDAEPRPASGTPLSSGGNFAVDVPPLDPGVPLGDLIPPTELTSTPLIFEDIGQFEDREPEAGTVSVQLDDDAKAGGNPGGPGDDPDSVNPSGFLPGSGGDGALSWDLLSGGAPAGFSYVDGPNGSILVQQVQGAITVTVLTITIDAGTGAYTVTQNAAILHPTLDGQAGDNTENNVTFTVGYTVTDSDGDVAPGTMTIDVDDDTPTVSVTAGSDANVILTTHDAATIGAASEAVSTSANFGGVFTGTTVSPGADGAGSGTTSGYALSTTGGASGLTQGGVAINLYNVSGVIVGSTAATSGGITAANTVFSVSVSGTGVVTLTQFSQIDHTNTDPSPTGAPFIDHIISLSDGSITLTRSETVVDRDGDSVTGSASVGIGANLRFVDDGPTISLADRGEDQLIVDETNLNINATGNFAANFSANFGADGPAVGGGIGYTLGINAGATGLVDTATDAAVVLSVVNGQVVGTAGAGGPVVFTVSVDANGIVTLDQQRAVVHDDPTDPVESGASAATLNADNLVTLTATATDRDGDTASQTINIGQNLHFEDDGPSLSNVQAGAGVTLDETTAVTPAGFPISGTSASAVISATPAFGADGAGTTTYGLSIVGGGATSLQTAIGNIAITLVQTDAQTITGQYNDGSVKTAFTVHINADGTVTVTENVPLEHLVDGSTPAAHNDALNLAGLINASITITDGDDDSATASVGIGNLITFLDDGPSIDVTQAGEGAVVLTTQDAQTIGAASDTDVSTANFSGVFGVSSAGGADGWITVSNSYALAVASSVSGLTSHGVAINLYNVGGVIVGSTSGTLGGINAGNTIFTVGVSATGVVTLTQLQQVDHALEGTTTSPFDDQFTVLADGKITLSLSSTITDNDGDTATDSEVVDLGGNIRFADDGPDVSAVLTGTLLKIDETDGVGVPGEVDPAGGNLGTITVAAATLFTVTNPHASADAPTTYGYALSISSPGVASGLLLSTTNAPVLLFNNAGVIEGRVGSNVGPLVFTASINAGTGEVTLTQFLAVEHTNTGSVDEDSSALTAGVLNVVITATDFDGDTDSASVDLGSVIRFEDDGPTIDVTASDDAGTILRTHDPDTIGAATDTSIGPVNFGVFGLTFNGGSDGAASTPTLSYTLGVSAPGVDSGLNQTGADIFLYVIAGKVVGSTSNTLIGVNAGNTVFDVSVNSSGVVTLTQYSQIDHPIAGDPSPTGTPFADHIISMTDSLVTLTASASITDNDGDTVPDSVTINIGNNLQFGDHGPTANDDTDSIVAGGDIATGNVITGADTDSGGAGADSSGADAPAVITGLVGAVTSDTNPTGGFIAQGNFGVLTMQADGSYSYDRNDGAPGNAQDIFTYTLKDFDGDTDTATLTINISDAAPVLTTPPALQLDDDNALGVTGNPGGPNDDAVSVPLSGTLIATGGDGDVDFFFNAAQTPPAGFTYNVVTGATTQTLTITQTSTGLVVTTVTLTNETGAYTVVQNNPVSHDTQDGIVGLDNTENNTPNFNIALVARDVDGDPSNVVNLVLNIDDDTPVLSNVAAGVGVTLDETTAGTPAGFPINAISASAAITATQAFGADGAALANSVVYGLSIVGDSPELTTLRTAVGDHLITLIQIDANTIQGQYNGTNVAFQIDIGTDGKITLTQNVPLEHNTDGSSAAAHDDSLNLSGFVNATITITDKDGDSTSASAPIGNQLVFKDDGPDAQLSGAAVGTVTLDETRPVDSDTAGGTAPNGDNQATINFAANFVTGGSVDFGADGGAASSPVSYALTLTGTNVASGLYALDPSDTVADADGIGQGSQIVLNQTSANTITGSVGATNYFTITIDPATGIVTFTQLNNIWHPTAGSSAAALDEAATLNTLAASAIKVVQTVTDSDGDFDTAEINVGQGVFIIQDDGPRFGTIQATLDIDNDSDPSGTGTLQINLGTDGPNSGSGNQVPDDLSVSNFTATVNGVAATNVVLTAGAENATTANYTFSFDYDTGDGGTATAQGTLVFNKGAGTYTVTLTNGPIEGFSVLATGTADASDFVEYQVPTGGSGSPEIVVAALDTDFFVQFSAVAEPASGTGANNLRTVDISATTGITSGTDDTGADAAEWHAGELFDQNVASVLVSSTAAGVAGNTIQGGEVLDFNLYATDPGNTQGLEATTSATSMFIVLDGIGDDEDMIVILKLYDTVLDVYTTKAFVVQNEDIIVDNATLVGTPYESIVLDNTDGIIVFEANDYQAGNTNLVIVGAQIAGSDEGITGSGTNLNGAIGATGGSSGSQTFDTDVSNAPFKITSIGFLTDSTEDQSATLEFDVTIHDADGDTASTHLTVNIGDPVAPLAAAVVSQEALIDSSDTSAFSLTADDPEQYRTMSYANNNSVLLGAIAAAGLGAGSQAAAHNFAPGGHEMLIDTSSFGYVGGDAQGFAIDSIDTVRSALGGETMEVVGFESFVESSSHHSAITEKLSLTDGAGDATLAPTALLQGTEAIDMEPAQSTLTSAAVGMPSAEMLVAGGDGHAVDGAPQSNGEVGRVLIDALAGGGGGPNIDAVLDAVTNEGGGGNAGLEAIASYGGGDVSPWHMADFAGYSTGHSAITMETMALHPDAVQTAA